MTLAQLQEKALELDPTDRLHLAEAMWDSLDEKMEPSPLSQTQQELIARRGADDYANPESS